MTQKVQLGEDQYDLYSMSDLARGHVNSLQFADQRLEELRNMMAILQRAKNSYVEDLRKEMLSQKAGLFFNED